MRTTTPSPPHRTAAGPPRTRRAAMQRAHASASPAVNPAHLALAHSIADAAASITTRYFRSPLPIDSKADASPVTIADREAEAAARAVIGREAPEHAVFGEEGGMTLPRVRGSNFPAGEYLWVIDPIDGTKSFITGTSEERGRAVAGLHPFNPHPILTSFFSLATSLSPRQAPLGHARRAAAPGRPRPGHHRPADY